MDNPWRRRAVHDRAAGDDAEAMSDNVVPTPDKDMHSCDCLGPQLMAGLRKVTRLRPTTRQADYPGNQRLCVWIIRNLRYCGQHCSVLCSYCIM